MRIFWERYGDTEPTILFLPTWSIIHSRTWKMQIPYLSRHCRVLTFDGRGNGRSDRPREPDAYRETEFSADALAVLDATGTESAVLVSLSRGAERALLLAAEHPERVAGLVFIAPALPLPPAAPRAGAEREFLEQREAYEGWGKWNSHYWPPNTGSSSSSSSHRSSTSRTRRNNVKTRSRGDAMGLGGGDVGRLGDVPGDGLAFPVEVGGEPTVVGDATAWVMLVDLLAAVVGHHVFGREAVLDIDAELALAGVLRQVADMTVGGEDVVVRRPGNVRSSSPWPGQFDDHQVP